MASAEDSPVAIVCVGMAGSGKTTFMQRINAHLHGNRTPPYVVNLDPAVLNVPFEPNIDIRDSVNYKEVMRQYNLGPNGGILTSLNLFATKIDQIIGLLEKRTKPAAPAPAQGTTTTQSTQPEQPAVKPIKHILVDTPGQIEVFVWSASGDILLGALASSFPTVIAYIIDTPRTASTSTFMSNMLYACSILYKTKLPMILVFNKTDVHDAEFAKEWMTDFETFQAALRAEEDGSSGVSGLEAGGLGGQAGGTGYMGSLLHSMSLVLEEFYKHLKVVGVSSMTGAGVDDFFAAVQDKKEEFMREYQPELDRKRAERAQLSEKSREKELGRLLADLNVGDRSVGGGAKRKPKKEEPETVSDAEEQDNENEDEEEDEDEDSEEDDEEQEPRGDEAMSRRYKQRLQQTRGGPQMSAQEEASFVNYVTRASLN